MTWQQKCGIQAMGPQEGVQAVVWWVCGVGWVCAGQNLQNSILTYLGQNCQNEENWDFGHSASLITF